MNLAIDSMTLDLNTEVTGQQIVDAVKKIVDESPQCRIIEKNGTTPGTIIIGQSSGFHSQRFIIGPEGDGTEEDDFAIHPTRRYARVRISPHDWPDNTLMVRHERSVYDNAIISMMEGLACELLEV